MSNTKVSVDKMSDSLTVKGVKWKKRSRGQCSSSHRRVFHRWEGFARDRQALDDLLLRRQARTFRHSQERICGILNFSRWDSKQAFGCNPKDELLQCVSFSVIDVPKVSAFQIIFFCGDKKISTGSPANRYYILQNIDALPGFWWVCSWNTDLCCEKHLHMR